MPTLYQAYVEADRAASALFDRYSEVTDETQWPHLRAAYDKARERADAARKALIESDEPRPWHFADDEGGRLLTVTLRPSEVEAHLRDTVANANSDGGSIRTSRVNGYAHCDDTDESFTIEVTI